jgi:hypothetical protein
MFADQPLPQPQLDQDRALVQRPRQGLMIKGCHASCAMQRLDHGVVHVHVLACHRLALSQHRKLTSSDGSTAYMRAGSATRHHVTR